MRLAGTLIQRLHPERLAGAVFEKELRQASRRRRTYIIRFLYLAGLTVVAFLAEDRVRRNRT